VRDARRIAVTLLAALPWIVGGNGSAAQPGPAKESPVEAASAAASQASASGMVAFTVDGRQKRFDSLPEGDNTYTPVASTIRAVSSAGGPEQLRITLMAIDLKKLRYPLDLPAQRGTSPRVDPMTAMASVGFSYRDEQAREWAGPGRIRVEAFGSDGLVTGSFADVSLPHTGKQLPKVTLTGGTFRARISAPW
jgi:hypothetical protein